MSDEVTTEQIEQEKSTDDRIIMTPHQLSERLERAKPSDYEELKAKAAEFDQQKEATKSAMDKVMDRLAKAESKAANAEKSMLRSKVQARFGINDEDAALFLTASDEETLVKVGERLSKQKVENRKKGNYVPSEGTSSSAKPGALQEFSEKLFGASK